MERSKTFHIQHTNKAAKWRWYNYLFKLCSQDMLTFHNSWNMRRIALFKDEHTNKTFPHSTHKWNLGTKVLHCTKVGNPSVIFPMKIEFGLNKLSWVINQCQSFDKESWPQEENVNWSILTPHKILRDNIVHEKQMIIMTRKIIPNKKVVWTDPWQKEATMAHTNLKRCGEFFVRENCFTTVNCLSKMPS